METKTQTAINSAGFTAEQQKYLEGFFAGAVQRGPIPFVGHTISGRITSDSSSGLINQATGPSEETYFGTPVSDLCKEERWKHEENPLDIWDKLLAHANEDKAPAPDDLFRFKFHGLFYVSPAQDSFMLRLRVPGAILSTYQCAALRRLRPTAAPAAPTSPLAAICRSASSNPETSSASLIRSRPLACPRAVQAQTTSATSLPRPSPVSILPSFTT